MIIVQVNMNRETPELLMADTEELTKTDQELKTPDMFRVVLHNDDYTTMEFVVEVITRVFHKSAIEASKIMLVVHRQGRGTAGVYTEDIAATKIQQVHRMAQKHNFPLRCTMEVA